MARYGPQGSLWAEHPEIAARPIRAWQIWNEPNLTRYWTPPRGQGFARSYVKLLRAAHRALRAADPGARTILAGLPNESWIALRRIYKAGGRRSFDAVALHPYTGKPRNVVRLAEYARREMRRFGDAPQADLGHRAVLAGGEGQDEEHDRLRDDRRAARPQRLGDGAAAARPRPQAAADRAGLLVHVALRRGLAERVRLVRTAPGPRRQGDLGAGARARSRRPPAACRAARRRPRTRRAAASGPYGASRSSAVMA